MKSKNKPIIASPFPEDRIATTLYKGSLDKIALCNANQSQKYNKSKLPLMQQTKFKQIHYKLVNLEAMVVFSLFCYIV